MNKLEKIYGGIVALVLVWVFYLFLTSGILDGNVDMSWGMFSLVMLPEVLILLPSIFLLVRLFRRVMRGGIVRTAGVTVQLILYTLASAFIIACIKGISIGFLFAFI
jgi:hypothetical protein